MTQSRDFPLAGGLMSYGGDFNQSHRQSGVYAGRILKGEKPADLPVQRVTKVELFINLKAAARAWHDLPAVAPDQRRPGHRMTADRRGSRAWTRRDQADAARAAHVALLEILSRSSSRRSWCRC